MCLDESDGPKDREIRVVFAAGAVAMSGTKTIKGSRADAGVLGGARAEGTELQTALGPLLRLRAVRPLGNGPVLQNMVIRGAI